MGNTAVMGSTGTLEIYRGFQITGVLGRYLYTKDILKDRKEGWRKGNTSTIAPCGPRGLSVVPDMKQHLRSIIITMIIIIVIIILCCLH